MPRQRLHYQSADLKPTLMPWVTNRSVRIGPIENPWRMQARSRDVQRWKLRRWIARRYSTGARKSCLSEACVSTGSECC